MPPASRAFATPVTRRFRGPWDRAIDSRTRSQQSLIDRLKRLQRAPLGFQSTPERCALCGGTQHPGIDSGRLFICSDCIQKAAEILAEAGARWDSNSGAQGRLT